MLDARLRPRIDPLVNLIAGGLAAMGVTANGVSLAGFAIGLLAAWQIAEGAFIAGLLLGILSRLCDALDGAVARRSGPTDFGGLLDIVLDFGFYGAIPLAFVLADPQANGLAGAILLLAFYVNGGSVLAFALMLEKQGRAEDLRGGKALAFTQGLMEGTETFVFFALFCLFPTWFPFLAVIFALLTAVTTTARLIRARATLR
ncbi:CDP-alcohol phosphatidyltransferase family protein [Fulvimarina endophytica]|uniref:CDP-alcohol phosphatidyltransferase family protein n=1 Tax=Fulvimarina endophytica TaxID=2293836 RepID=A0A371X2V7_9HYPH|nr:CDP-alcohol phosphatidyltransferase family protein [Fulvimarina endophytica]RFC63374.1 CDP-alcohol phosphatidyltransferase family protein [Fulvimarina endophytica]